MKRLFVALAALALLISAFASSAIVASAATACTFTTVGSTMTLDADCTTDATILIPDGMTLDGNGHSITAVDPVGGHFEGAVVKNGGATAHVTNLTVRAAGLANVCDAGNARLRGIMFEGAGGTITHTVADDINQGASGCQEGNAIEIRHLAQPDMVSVEIAHTTVTDYQKTGIAVLGNINASIHHNTVGDSATQANLAANSVQVSDGASASVEHNQIDGNSWYTASAAATAVLLYNSGPVTVRHNNIGGNADVGIYILADGVQVDNNRVFESGTDGVYDFGIGNWGSGNEVTNNKVRGYDIPYDGVTGGKNKTIPTPNP